MSTPHITQTFNDFVTGDTCLQYITKDMGLLSRCDWQGDGIVLPFQQNIYDEALWAARGFSSQDTGASSVSYSFYSDITKISQDKTKRIIGLILDEWGDGSFKIAILGDDNLTNMRYSNIRYTEYASADPCERVGETQIFKGNCQSVAVYDPGSSSDNVPGVTLEEFTNEEIAIVPLENIFDFVPTLGEMTNLRGALYGTGSHGNGAPFRTGAAVNLHVTNNKNNTLIIGNKYNINGVDRQFIATEYLRESPYNMRAGNFYDFMENLTVLIAGKVNTFSYMEGVTSYNEWIDPLSDDSELSQAYETTTLQTIPVNLILTRNESFALNYLNTGTLPPDAFLFPMDWENIPKNMPSGEDEDTPEGGDDPDNGENNPSGIEGDPTVDGDPTTTTSKLNNNNVYWLQAGQLADFITWFWNDAGAIIDAGSLWNKITGLYNDLGQAIVMVRYFPVDPAYLGGTEDVNSIVVGMIEKPNTQVKKLVRGNPSKVTLGTQAISPKYNSFADYSPYTELQLYLPFHGWQALDVDIFMGNSVRVKAIYDYMSGTVQYLIYVVSGGNEYLVNTAVVKMAVDVPITLQSKNDRDSAIFGNIMNAAGTLIGASASAATMNPIGLTMSMQNIASIGTGGAQSAPIKMMGTQGENGAFFAPNRCAIYMKRPSYNRPKLYKSRVGYPCNKGVYLGARPSGGDSSVGVATGFTTVYNPTITFSGNSFGGKRLLPLQSEIEEIYNYLTEGVIL